MKKALDYEQKQSYTFTVTAKDGGNKTATASVNILVQDVNDNAPVFQNSPYSANVAENVNVGYGVGTVTATDADSGPRGRVSYSIVNGNTGNAFRINAAGKVKCFFMLYFLYILFFILLSFFFWIDFDRNEKRAVRIRFFFYLSYQNGLIQPALLTLPQLSVVMC